VTSARDDFGPGLRADRERAGISLEAIAKATKIKQALLVGLEQNDLSQWPVGIFRRAFFREYLATIGLTAQSESLVADFIRLFPEAGAPTMGNESDGSGDLRLILADTPRDRVRLLLIRAVAAAVDLSIAILLALVVALVFGFSLSASSAAAALAYYSLSVAWLGCPPAAFWLTRHRKVLTRRVIVRLPAGTPPLRIVKRHREAVDRRSASDDSAERHEPPARFRASSR
jgi:transcriptional regulator with XRE-family HTH domain